MYNSVKFHQNGRVDLSEFAPKSCPKRSQNPLKSTFGALLEHFGDPLGAQVAQE